MDKKKKNQAAGRRVEDFRAELFGKSAAAAGSRDTGDDQHSKAHRVSLEYLVSEVIDATMRAVVAELEDEIYSLRRTVDENYNLQAEPMAWIMREVSDCKAPLTEIRDIQVSNGRPKAETPKRRLGTAA
ncbi:hypothetical protein [Burkholderia pseudomallei]|uniref:hypothetical protein n=1 Tax=Burkholderia pseudomallei TaxID=28450 RepID=UPI0011C4C7F7|nr:hypothetical protein [Burkholderia pseudomallei]